MLKGTVAVTGGAGFIGSHLVDTLIGGGCEVVVLDDFSSGSRENLPAHGGGPGLRVIEIDILDEKAVAAALSGARWVFHLATRNVRLSLRRPTEVHEVNATGTFNVLKGAAAAGVERLLYCSSSEVNGTADFSPLPEKYHFRPETIYGASKLSGEYYARVFNSSGWLETVVARPYNNYGPRAHYRGHLGEVIPVFILRALAGLPIVVYGAGDQTRDFCYVTDTSDILARLIDHPDASGGTYNVCSGVETSIGEIARLVVELTGSNSKIENRTARPSDVLKLAGDPSKLQSLLGRSPGTPLRDGLERTIDWYRRNVKIDDELLSLIDPGNWETVPAEEWMTGPRGDGCTKCGVGDGSQEEKIQLTVPVLGREEKDAACRAIDSRWVTQGERVAEFEGMFAEYAGAEYACAVSSCTAALHLSLLAAGVRPGDVVITASHSFIATANAVRHCGAEPVFVDIEEDSMNIDPALLAEMIEKDFKEHGGQLWYRDVEKLSQGNSPLCRIAGRKGRLAAVLPVHQVGMPAHISAIAGIARGRGAPVVEDAACAAGSEVFEGGEWQKVGRPHGDFACFSFHPRKIVTTGEGGMITTGDAEAYRLLRLLRHQGMSVTDLERHGADEPVFEEYPVTGFNYRMTDIQAAIGIEQLKKLPGIVAERRRLAAKYDELLSGIPGVEIYAAPEYARPNGQSYVVRLSDGKRQLEVLKRLRLAGIAATRGIMCAHLEPAYSASWPLGCLPRSERARDAGIILPLYPGMTDGDIERVASELKKSLG